MPQHLQYCRFVGDTLLGKPGSTRSQKCEYRFEGDDWGAIGDEALPPAHGQAKPHSTRQ